MKWYSVRPSAVQTSLAEIILSRDKFVSACSASDIDALSFAGFDICIFKSPRSKSTVTQSIDFNGPPPTCASERTFTVLLSDEVQCRTTVRLTRSPERHRKPALWTERDFRFRNDLVAVPHHGRVSAK